MYTLLYNCNVCFTFVRKVYTMKKLHLLAPQWKWIGLAMVLPGLVLGALSLFDIYNIPWFQWKIRAQGDLFKPEVENFTNELALTLVLVGLLLICFSKEKQEDERIQFIRLEAFQWSILVNFIVILVGNWTLYGGDFFYLMTLNLFTPLLVFLARFYYVLYVREGNTLASEEHFL